MLGAAGSFAAISTLLGSPITGAFLLMEASGLGGPMMGLVLLPGLLASGVGALIFVGLDSWTGFGTFEMRRRSERHGINPQTRARITIGATNTPGFTASSTFKDRVLAEGEAAVADN